MWKPPPRRKYQPKLMDPGQVIVWTVTTPGQDRHERIGTIWSEATSPSSWWVVPDDDERNPVVVRRHGKKFSSEHREGELYESREFSGWRENIRRAENVRRRGLYAVVVQTQAGSYEHWSRRQRPDTHFVSWHADPDCPSAARYERWDGEGHAYHASGPDGERWNPLTAADVLVGRVPWASDPPFCGRCVMFTEPAPASALAA